MSVAAEGADQLVCGARVGDDWQRGGFVRRRALGPWTHQEATMHTATMLRRRGCPALLFAVLSTYPKWWSGG